MTPQAITDGADPLSSGADELSARCAALEDLVATLDLYVGWHTWKKLTTAQKELFADTVEEAHRAADEEDGYTGTPMAFAPVDRWWRTGGNVAPRTLDDTPAAHHASSKEHR